MDTIIEVVRDIIGEADFYRQLTSNSNYTWDYAAMIEYVVAALLMLTVVSFVFKIILSLFKRGT